MGATPVSHYVHALRLLAVRAMRSGQRCIDRHDYAAAAEFIELAADLADALAAEVESVEPEQADKLRLIGRMRRRWAAEADIAALVAS
ncbi:hypothetical protein [Prauserella endophytica]|uniref:Uncharacterized protein n=1 Tax=Prauserella endophytica TaxID=1592324 RepID=A0ABY2RUW1_9PSEU|nr:hypothetical protein [Prauserella endophytica]TKG61498.1 hypothetical protein FCN18_33190 [Prauserella endophytica]